MDVDSDNYLELERNGTASNSDSYLTHVEYRVPLCVWFLCLDELINVIASAKTYHSHSGPELHTVSCPRRLCLCPNPAI